MPADVTVAFLFDPFGREVVGRVLDRILDSLAQAPRSLCVLYLHPRFADLFRDAGFDTVYDQGRDGTVLRRRAIRPA